VFAGIFVLESEGTGVVTATGSATRLGSIAQMTHAARRPPTPLAQELNRVVRTIALVASGVGAVFLVISVLVGIRLTDRSGTSKARARRCHDWRWGKRRARFAGSIYWNSHGPRRDRRGSRGRRSGASRR